MRQIIRNCSNIRVRLRSYGFPGPKRSFLQVRRQSSGAAVKAKLDSDPRFTPELADKVPARNSTTIHQSRANTPANTHQIPLNSGDASQSHSKPLFTISKTASGKVGTPSAEFGHFTQRQNDLFQEVKKLFSIIEIIQFIQTNQSEFDGRITVCLLKKLALMKPGAQYSDTKRINRTIILVIRALGPQIHTLSPRDVSDSLYHASKSGMKDGVVQLAKRLEELSEQLTPWDIAMGIRGLSSLGGADSHKQMEQLLKKVSESMADYNLGQLGIIFTALAKSRLQTSSEFVAKFEALFTPQIDDKLQRVVLLEILAFYAGCTDRKIDPELAKRLTSALERNMETLTPKKAASAMFNATRLNLDIPDRLVLKFESRLLDDLHSLNGDAHFHIVCGFSALRHRPSPDFKVRLAEALGMSVLSLKDRHLKYIFEALCEMNVLCDRRFFQTLDTLAVSKFDQLGPRFLSSCLRLYAMSGKQPDTKFMLAAEKFAEPNAQAFVQFEVATQVLVSLALLNQGGHLFSVMLTAFGGCLPNMKSVSGSNICRLVFALATQCPQSPLALSLVDSVMPQVKLKVVSQATDTELWDFLWGLAVLGKVASPQSEVAQACLFKRTETCHRDMLDGQIDRAVEVLTLLDFDSGGGDAHKSASNILRAKKLQRVDAKRSESEIKLDADLRTFGLPTSEDKKKKQQDIYSDIKRVLTTGNLTWTDKTCLRSGYVLPAVNEDRRLVIWYQEEDQFANDEKEAKHDGELPEYIPRGTIKMRELVLRSLGWNPVPVPFYEWDMLDGSGDEKKLEYLRSKVNVL
eukprot:188306_1